MVSKSAIVLALSAILVFQLPSQAQAASSAQPEILGVSSDPLDPATLDSLRALYKKLIDAENRHDIAAVRPMVWDSGSALFVAKTATPEEGNWAGFWGKDLVVEHLQDLYRAGSFRIEPDYAREKVVGISREVAETYVPVKITVAYAGQTPVPKPFLMIIDWVSTPDGWRMATDIALPIPPTTKR